MTFRVALPLILLKLKNNSSFPLKPLLDYRTFNYICNPYQEYPCGGIGRRARLRGVCPMDVWVRLPSWVHKSTETPAKAGVSLFIVLNLVLNISMYLTKTHSSSLSLQRTSLSVFIRIYSKIPCFENLILR